MKFVPDFDEYKYEDGKVLAEISKNPTKLRNASLAIQLSYDWIRRNSHKLENKMIDECLTKASNNDLILPPKFAEALINCHWPGRCQTVHWKNLHLYIDGAHTTESLQLCLDWFKSMTESRSARGKNRTNLYKSHCLSSITFPIQLPQKISAI